MRIGISLSRLLALSVVSLVAASTAHADWKSDEAHIKRLQRRAHQLKQTVALFERHRRALELVEAEIANVQLGLADPSSRPDALVRRLLKEAYPRVSISMVPRRTRAPRGIGVWVWRCELRGMIGELRWATQLLRQKGLFVKPSAEEPVQLLPDRDQQSGALVFYGHHVRLKDLSFRKAKSPRRPDYRLLAQRSDPLAAKIRALQAEVARLRVRVAEIQGFEARIRSIRQYILLLKKLTRESRDPFRSITPLLDLELIQYSAIQHQKNRVVITGSTPSKSTRTAARRWLRRLSRRARVRYKVKSLVLQYRPRTRVALSIPDTVRGNGPRCRLLAAEARAVDVAIAATRRGVVIIHPQKGRAKQSVTGQSRGIPCDRALAAAAAGIGLHLLRVGRDVLLVPKAAASKARVLLRRKSHRGRGKPVRISVTRKALGEVLALLRGGVPGSLEAPRAAISDQTPVTLQGRMPIESWLRLLGAGLGHKLSGHRDGTLKLTSGETRVYPVPDPPERSGPLPVSVTRLGLSQLRPALIVLGRAGRSFAVVAAPDGRASTISRGALVGRNRSQLLRVRAGGLRLLWSGSGVTARLTLPPGERR